MATRRKLELLSPARDCEIGRQAIIHGADAVYIGAEAFGARAAATNSVDDIAQLADFAHRYDARVYVTLNTLIYDDELRRAEQLIDRLYHAGVDALIVQDLSVLRMDIPPIALHASTQCDTRTVEKARFLEACGFSQIVLARELSLDEIRQICESVKVPVEVFVHGALCVSYSGDCQASYAVTGRSANRGECAQMCRLPYSLVDASGRKVADDAHYLSLRDMNRIDLLGELADAGVSSFKIEGRLKDSDYVRNVTAAYSTALDRVIEADSRYERQSVGHSKYNFDADVNKSFNRGFTHYFMNGAVGAKAPRMASLATPKWIGEEVGRVTGRAGKNLKVKLTKTLSNGDGLGYFDRDGRYCGFRLNRVEGDVLMPASAVNPAQGTVLYRNRDKQRDDVMKGTTAERRVVVDAALRRVDDNRIALQLTDERGIRVECVAEAVQMPARTAQKSHRQTTMSRLGDSIYTLRDMTDMMNDDEFVAVSVLTALRNKTIDTLDRCRSMRRTIDYRRPLAANIAPYKTEALDRHDNIANRLSREFVTSLGMKVAEPALEVQKKDKQGEIRVMTCRYCVRRELGACLKTPEGRRLPQPLYIKSSAGDTFRLDFDCTKCRMEVIKGKSE